MSFLFVSHASTDKAERIRPLVECLIDEGETVWVDRPGSGADGLGFDQGFIDLHRVRSLPSGRPWPLETADALGEAGAVLGCLSRAVLESRPILKDELTYADLARKLVTCIVDDLGHDRLPAPGAGLLDLRKYHSITINCRYLRDALDQRRVTGCPVEQLPAHLASEWEKVRHLLARVDQIRHGPRIMRPADVRDGAERLRQIPVGPVFHVRDLPAGIIDAFCNGLDTTERIESTLWQAHTILVEAFPEGFTERQILVRKAQLPPVGTLSTEAFWTQLFGVAGLKGRRTLASFLICPNGRWTLRRAGADGRADALLAALARG